MDFAHAFIAKHAREFRKNEGGEKECVRGHHDDAEQFRGGNAAAAHGSRKHVGVEGDAHQDSRGRTSSIPASTAASDCSLVTHWSGRFFSTSVLVPFTFPRG